MSSRLPARLEMLHISTLSLKWAPVLDGTKKLWVQPGDTTGKVLQSPIDSDLEKTFCYIDLPQTS